MSGFRAAKVGDAYRTEQKFEARYDEEEKLGTPAAIITWMSKVLGSDMGATPATDWQAIHNHLKDGVVLCKLINKLNTFAGKPTVKAGKATSSFSALSNIENFNLGAKDFGVPATALFQPPDLYEGRKAPMLNVINCLNQLGFVANSKGFNPKYEGPAPPKCEM
jgi:hypothetical protein